jgi:hypothetical protein
MTANPRVSWAKAPPRKSSPIQFDGGPIPFKGRSPRCEFRRSKKVRAAPDRRYSETKSASLSRHRKNCRFTGLAGRPPKDLSASPVNETAADNSRLVPTQTGRSLFRIQARSRRALKSGPVKTPYTIRFPKGIHGFLAGAFFPRAKWPWA